MATGPRPAHHSLVKRARLLVLLTCAACSREAPSSTPPGQPSAASPAAGQGSARPEPEVERVSPPELATLRYVANAVEDFPYSGKPDTLRLIVQIIEPEEPEEGKKADPWYAFTEQLADGDHTVPLDPALEAEHAFRPSQDVWLFGADGPCKTELGPGFAWAETESGYLTLKIGYEVERCTKAPSPIVYLGDEPPPVKWTPIEQTAYEMLEDPQTWQHPKRAALEKLGLLEWDAEDGDPDIVVRIHEAGDIVELGYAHHWPADTCEEEEQGIYLEVGRWVGDHVEPLPAYEHPYAHVELVGALYGPNGMWAVVADSQFQLQLGYSSEAGWSWTELQTGVYHDEDIAYWGWSVLENYCGP